MSINNINRSTSLTDVESTNVNQKQLSDNIKTSKPEQTNLPTDKSSKLIANSKIQEGNFTASYQSAKLQNMIPSNTSSNTNTKGINVKYEAEQIIKANTKFLDLDEAKLGKTLATVSKEQPNLVKETLSQLSQSDKVQVTQAFVDELQSKDRLKDLAKTPEGNKLLLEAYNTLSGQSGFLKNSDPKLELIGSTLANVAKEKVNQNQPQNASSNKVAPPPQAKIEGSKARELPLNAIPKQGNPEIRYELPLEGTGYKFYNRNDADKASNYSKSNGVAAELVGKRMPDQIGTKDTTERLETLASEWNKRYPDKKLQYGDISLPGGVPTKAHKGHQDGYKVDVRPLRNDDKIGNLTIHSSEYNRNLTREFIQLVLEKYPNTKFKFNDTELIKEFSGVVTRSDISHNNHIHIEFSPKDGKK
ncbi:MAG: hypothetical protein HY819_23360 [Acidobacteria bacterium]|nr:hypothetical protein [Acidobacteriota bacterium]